MNSELLEDKPIGILRGPSARGNFMDIVSPHLSDPPARGDFVLIPAENRMLVLRIAAAHATGSFAESSERGADYLSQLARQGGGNEVPERIRELLLRFRLEAVALGWLQRGTAGWTFEPGVRALQLFGQRVWRASEVALRILVNAGLESEPADQRVRIGCLARGHESVTNVPVEFSIRRLKGKRTFVFARAGYGKSNLVKLLLSRLYQAPPEVGLLLVDPEGEYAFSQESETGRTIRGLLDHPSIRHRVKVFTGRNVARLPEGVRASVAGDLRLDLSKVSPEEFLSAFVPDEKHEQVWANRLLAGGRPGFEELVRLFRRRGYGAPNEEIGKALGFKVKAGGSGDQDVSTNAIRNNVCPVVKRLDGTTDLPGDVASHLNTSGVVVLDVSAVGHADADSVLQVVLSRVFQERVRRFTDGADRGVGVLLVMEEAQTVLGGRALDDRNIYVRWVKEGRKYGLGAVMITQQPGAISEHLVSQGDNFFAMHLLAQRDLNILGQANAHFTPEILEFLRSEPVKGNCYFWSAPDQPYVVGVRVDNYEDRALDVAADVVNPVTAAKAAEDPSRPARTGRDAKRPSAVRTSEPVRSPKEGAMAATVREETPDLESAPSDPSSGAASVERDLGVREAVAEAVMVALCRSPRVFIMTVASVDGSTVEGVVAVSRDFLATNLPDADALAAREPELWSRTAHGPRAGDALLDATLHELELLHPPGSATAPRGGRPRMPVVLLSVRRLEECARARELPLPGIRSDELVCSTVPGRSP